MENKKIYYYLTLLALALVVSGVLAWKINSLNPKFIKYENASLGFRLMLPTSWQGVTELEEGTDHVKFIYQPQVGEPALLLAIYQERVQAGLNLSNGELQRVTSRVLRQQSDRIYYAQWSAGNPYQGAEAQRYLFMARNIDAILDSFELLPKVNSDPSLCIQVITPARNRITGEIKNFPTPCAVPAGWEMLAN